MKIKINSKIYDIENYISPWKRLIGFIGKKDINKIICFPRCNSIHTFFMKCPIGVIFLDRRRNVIKVVKHLKINRICTCKRARYVIECNINLLKDKPEIKIIR